MADDAFPLCHHVSRCTLTPTTFTARPRGARRDIPNTKYGLKGDVCLGAGCADVMRRRHPRDKGSRLFLFLGTVKRRLPEGSKVTGEATMAKQMPSREMIAAQLQALSKEKGMPLTYREYAHHPSRLCSPNALQRMFGVRSWHEILKACGIQPREYDSPDQVICYILDFYDREHRWPQARDLKKPCSHWIVKKVFRSAENAVAAVTKAAQEKLTELKSRGIPIADFLSQHLISSAPQPLPSTSPVTRSGFVYGPPTGYPLFPYAPTHEKGVEMLFGILIGARELKFIPESTNPSGFPDCKAKRFVPGRGYVDADIEFKTRSRDYLQCGYIHESRQCDHLVCWEDNWPQDQPRPHNLQVIALKSVLKSVLAKL